MSYTRKGNHFGISYNDYPEVQSGTSSWTSESEEWVDERGAVFVCKLLYIYLLTNRSSEHACNALLRPGSPENVVLYLLVNQGFIHWLPGSIEQAILRLAQVPFTNIPLQGLIYNISTNQHLFLGL